jgi:hypothetical protein
MQNPTLDEKHIFPKKKRNSDVEVLVILLLFAVTANPNKKPKSARRFLDLASKLEVLELQEILNNVTIRAPLLSVCLRIEPQLSIREQRLVKRLR